MTRQELEKQMMDIAMAIGPSWIAAPEVRVKKMADLAWAEIERLQLSLEAYQHDAHALLEINKALRGP
jgi:hypothetical protein